MIWPSITSLISFPTDFPPHSLSSLLNMPNRLPLQNLYTWYFYSLEWYSTGYLHSLSFTSFWSLFKCHFPWSDQRNTDLRSICIWVTAKVMVLVRLPKEYIHSEKIRWLPTEPWVTPLRKRIPIEEEKNQQRVR